MKAQAMSKDPLKVKPSSKNNNKVSEHHIRQRAFEIFADRNDDDEGTEATDWFQAEYELTRPRKKV